MRLSPECLRRSSRKNEKRGHASSCLILFFLQNIHRLIMKLGVATLPVYLVCTIWAVFLANIILPLRLNAYGIVPRTTGGLFGIVFTNFLHANIGHIISNTAPLFTLSLLLALFYRKIFFDAIAIIIGCGGLLVWLFARPTNHIGASMLIYGLAAFLICYG